jgi:hypothetical protein
VEKEKTSEQEEATTSGEAATNGEIVKEDTKEARRVKGGQEEEEEEENKADGELNVSSPDPYYPPIIYLPEVVVNSGHLLSLKGLSH